MYNCIILLFLFLFLLLLVTNTKIDNFGARPNPQYRSDFVTHIDTNVNPTINFNPYFLT
jgi:hypothetical protein